MADDQNTSTPDTGLAPEQTTVAPTVAEQAPNGIAAPEDQTNTSTPATATQPVNNQPVSDAPSNENNVEQTTGESTEATTVPKTDDATLISRLDQWVKDNYDALVEAGTKTWDDVEKNAKELGDYATAAFARHRAAGVTAADDAADEAAAAAAASTSGRRSRTTGK